MKKIFVSIVLIFISGIFVSCEDDRSNPNNNGNNNHYVNNWIYDNMSIYYLWNNKIPASPDYEANPDDFFNSICNWYNENTNPDGDRFSWIQENYVDLLNSLSGVSSDEIGFEFQLFYVDDKHINIGGEVLYVKKGTPAASKGLKRGDFFTEINGTQLTASNYKDILNGLKGDYKLSIFTPLDEKNLSNKRYMSLSTVSKYEENPVYFSNVYNYDDKNIGYLVYNFFADDNGDGLCGYDAQLAQVFANFKSQNVNSLILDLRYNSGGSTLAATVLASMIVKDLNPREIFYKTKCNSMLEEIILEEMGADYFNQYFMTEISPNKNYNNLTTPISLPNIGNNLQEVYILTGPNTASSSELIINGLKPYMNVILLGTTTIGKNVASISLYEGNDPKNKWGIQPIVFKMYNSDNESDFTAGFSPAEDFINDDSNVSPKKELGDPKENMLSDAIKHITGVNTLKSGTSFEKISYKKISSSMDDKPWRNQGILKFKSLPVKK